MKRPSRKRAERIVEKILTMKNGQALRAIERLEMRLSLKPMQAILAKLPAKTPTERCRLLEITRQAYYDWINEKTRPNIQQAIKLSKLTGFSIKEIRGRE